MRGKKNNVSEEQFAAMKAFYLDDHTLQDTAVKFGLGYGFVYDHFKKRGWVRGRGIRVKPNPVGSFEDSALVEAKARWDRLDATVKGTVAEGYVKMKLAELGYDVWEPAAQNHRTDLIVLGRDGVTKIQVKASSYDTKSKSFRANLSRRSRGRGRACYDESDVDLFIVYCAGLPATTFYVMPSGLAEHRSTPRLFPHRDKALEFTDFSWEAYRDAFHLVG